MFTFLIHLIHLKSAPSRWSRKNLNKKITWFNAHNKNNFTWLLKKLNKILQFYLNFTRTYIFFGNLESHFFYLLLENEDWSLLYSWSNLAFTNNGSDYFLSQNSWYPSWCQERMPWRFTWILLVWHQFIPDFL